MNVYVYIEYISFYMYYFIAIYMQTHKYDMNKTLWLPSAVLHAAASD